MDAEVKQRQRRRKRAQRMQQQRDHNKGEPDSADEDELPVREKPQRPPNRRKKTKEPLVEEDIVDGFAILGFKSYEDLELVLKLATKENIRRLVEIEATVKPQRQEREPTHRTHITPHHISHHHPTVTAHGLTLTQDPATSDDSGRASERLTSSSVAPRDADSSRDRLSDASSRCSSGKGYICDSEGEDDKGSDASSVIFASTPATGRKHEFPGALPPSLPSLNGNGAGGSPVPAPTPPDLPAPSPAPAQLPPPPPQIVTAAATPHLQHPIGGIIASGTPASVATQQPSTPQGASLGPIKPPAQPAAVTALPPVAPGMPPQAASMPQGAFASINPPSLATSVRSNQPLQDDIVVVEKRPMAPGNDVITVVKSSCSPPPASSVPPQNTAPIPPCSASVATGNHLPSVPPIIMPQPMAAAPMPPHHHPPATIEGTAVPTNGSINHARTESPAVATSAPSYHTPYQPLYTPYAVHSPYSTTTTTNVPSAPSAAAVVTASQPPHPQPPQPIYPPPSQTHPSHPAQIHPSQSHHAAPTHPPQPHPTQTHPPQAHPPPSHTLQSHSSQNRPSSQGHSSQSRPSSQGHTSQGHQQPQTNHPLQPAHVISSAVTVPTVSAATVTTTPSHHHQSRETITSRSLSPRGHSPNRERESYSNVSSLSRGSVTPLSCPPPTSVVSSSLTMGKPWTSGPSTQLSPAPPRPTPPLHSTFPPPMFAAPLPPSVSTASPLASSVPPPVPPNPNPFSAESLFQTNQADMLRRELDNRFLASHTDSRAGPLGAPYLRTEMHQHQHHHTHVHQHTTSLLPPPGASSLFPTPLFKDIPKLGSVESPFYRQSLGMPNYPGYTPSLLHPGLTGPTPFVPPNHLPSFQPKPPQASIDPAKPKITKTGKWNAMHVRVAWEIYHHQHKGDTKPGTLKTDLLRPPTHLFSPSVHSTRPHELTFPPSLSSHRPPPTFDQPHPGSLFSAPPSHIGSTMSPFTRYGAAGFAPNSSPFSVSPFASTRDLPLGPLHDPWRGLQRTVPTFPPSVSALPPSLPGLPPAPWTLKPDPILEQREREERERAERERERLRREREERERREREEKQRRLEQQQQQERERERREKERREIERREMERERERERLLHQQRLAESTKQLPQPPMLRDRSPMRNGVIDPSEVRVKEEPRTKDEDPIMLSRAPDPRYHPYLRPPPTLQPPSVLDRSRMIPTSLAHHYPPPPTASHWPPPPTEAYYRYDPLRGYNPLMDAAIRAEEERVKLFASYGAHPGQLRPKEPGLMHLRPGAGPGPPMGPSKLCATPPTDIHKKEEPR